MPISRFSENLPALLADEWWNCRRDSVSSQSINRAGTLRFERRDSRVLLQDIAELVHAFQKTMFREAVDGELHRAPIRQCKLLGNEVDFQHSSRICQQPRVYLMRNHNRQQRILQ